jgi:hypothetical protein
MVLIQIIILLVDTVATATADKLLHQVVAELDTETATAPEE